MPYLTYDSLTVESNIRGRVPVSTYLLQRQVERATSRVFVMLRDTPKCYPGACNRPQSIHLTISSRCRFLTLESRSGLFQLETFQASNIGKPIGTGDVGSRFDLAPAACSRISRQVYPVSVVKNESKCLDNLPKNSSRLCTKLMTAKQDTTPKTNDKARPQTDRTKQAN